MIHITDSDGVTFKTCTAEVFRPASTRLNARFASSILVIETRKDSAVHVSLSSSSLVKQPRAQDLGPERHLPSPEVSKRLSNLSVKSSDKK